MSLMPFLSIPVMALLVALQSALFAYAPVLGSPVQIAVVVLFAWAMWRGPAEGCVWAFFAGLFIDYASISPMGVSSAALIVAVVVIAPFFPNLEYNRLTLPLLLAGIAMLTFQLVSVLLLTLARYPIGADFIRLLPATTVLHALVTLPVFWLVSAFGRFARRERTINL